MKYKITKTIDLPEYTVIDMGVVNPDDYYFKLIPDREGLTDDQIYYMSDMGWRLVVDYMTLRVLSPPKFQGRILEEISQETYKKIHNI